MDTGALKKFAQAARNQLIEQVKGKLGLVLAEGSPARREARDAVKYLETAIGQQGRDQLIEQVAYTWFNRFTALRFMDVKGYNAIGAVSPAEGQTRPELLAEALKTNIDAEISAGNRAKVEALLDGRSPSGDAQGEAYRLLLVAVCNQWHEHMPFMFEKINDYTELLMPDDLLSQNSILSHTRKAMTEEACKDVEVIGWLYQFYISEKKDQVFAGLKKNQKITAENIPAATQLFTPHWIVRYLVENSLGRLWLLNRPSSKLAERMDYYIAPEESETDFLRVTKPEDIKICDPACGSAHMLTYAFDLLHDIYEEEGYDPVKIPALILHHNLTGIEIDDRAGALAAFALSMKAASQLGRRRFLRMEVRPNIVVLQNVSFTSAEMADVAAVVGGDLFTGKLRETLGQFEQAKNFGSLIVPKLRDPAEALRAVEARDFGGDLLLKEVQERVVAVLHMAEALSSKYHVVVANPPYMGSGGMNPEISNFARLNFPDSSSDLYAMFIERCISLNIVSGLSALVTIQNWMFISSFEKLRGKLLSEYHISDLVQIGFNSFPELNSKVVQAASFVIKNGGSKYSGRYINLNDAAPSANKNEIFKSKILGNHVFLTENSKFSLIPGSPLGYWLPQQTLDIFGNLKTIGDFAAFKRGMATGDNGKFLRIWHEVAHKNTNLRSVNSVSTWHKYNKGGEFRRWYGNQEYVIFWKDSGNAVRNFKDEKGKLRSRPQNIEHSYKPAVSYSSLTSGTPSMRFFDGFIHDQAGNFMPCEEVVAISTLAMLNSKPAYYFLQIFNSTLNILTSDLNNIPVAPETSETAEDIGACLVRASQFDWDAYETSWDFATLPLLSLEHRAETLEGTFTKLRTHWQGMTDEMQRLEEENNRIFIDAYGLQSELTPEVPLNEITLTCNPAYRYGIKNDTVANETRLRADTMAELLSYAVGCMFGRYSIDAPGLVLANQGERLADYLARIPEPSFLPDEDNVIPVLDSEWFADDVTERFRKFLRTTFGDDNYRENLAFIENALGKDIRKWFTRDFFDYHVRRFKKRPIYWLFSSPKGTFSALMYMHRYRPETVSVLLNDYLREHIRKLETYRVSLEKTADDPSTSPGQASKARKETLVVSQQIDELKDWEREVVFPLAQQRIEIDLDDGVKANYPKFGAALKVIKGLEAADE